MNDSKNQMNNSENQNINGSTDFKPSDENQTCNTPNIEQADRKMSSSQSIKSTQMYKSFKSFWNYVGPGFLIAIACLDPGNLAGDIAAGQHSQLRLVW